MSKGRQIDVGTYVLVTIVSLFFGSMLSALIYAMWLDHHLENEKEIKTLTVVEKYYEGSPRYTSVGVDSEGNVSVPKGGDPESYVVLTKEGSWKTKPYIWAQLEKGQTIKVSVNGLKEIEKIID